MKIPFKFTLLVIFLLFHFSTYAQKHNLQPGWCRYAKPGKGKAMNESASAQCKVCDAEREKEKKDKEIADKASADRLAIKNKEDKLASEAKFKQQSKDNKERNKVTEVFVKMPKSSTVASAPSKKMADKKAVAPGKMIYMTRNSFGTFRNSLTDEELTPAVPFPFYAVEGTYMEDGTISRNNFPANYGVIQLDKTIDSQNHPATANFYQATSYKVHDLVDSKLNRIFNSDSIARIVHFYGNWFLISYDFAKIDWITHSFGAVKFYNVKTKESIAIPEKSYRQAIELATFRFHGMDNQPVARNYRYFKGSYEGDGADGKKTHARSACEETLDNIVGGADKWKAFIAVKPFKSKSDRSIDGYVYYCNANEKIVKIKVTNDDLTKLRG